MRALPTSYWRLKPSFAEKLLERRPELPSAYQREYDAALKAGKPVRLAVAEAILETLQSNAEWRHLTLKDAFADDWASMRSASSLTNAIMSAFRERTEMRIQAHEVARELPAVARLIMQCVGSKVAQPGEHPDADSCLRRGEEHMGISFDQYWKWLRDMHNEQPRCIMYSLCSRKESADGFLTSRSHKRPHARNYDRVGVTVTFPLSQSAFQRLCNGKIAHCSLTPDDLECPTPYIYYHAVAEPIDVLTDLNYRRIRLAQAHSLHLQTAYFTRDSGIPYNPQTVSHAVRPDVGQMLASQGFRATGKNMLGTDHPIMACPAVKGATMLTRRERRANFLSDMRSEMIYWAKCRLLEFYQDRNADIWGTGAMDASDDLSKHPKTRRYLKQLIVFAWAGTIFEQFENESRRQSLSAVFAELKNRHPQLKIHLRAFTDYLMDLQGHYFCVKLFGNPSGELGKGFSYGLNKEGKKRCRQAQRFVRTISPIAIAALVYGNKED